MHKLASLLSPLLLLAPALHAQSIVTVNPQQCVWRAGDNPAWSAPSLDESLWQPYASQPSSEPYFWIRCHADLASLQGSAHPALQIRLYAAYQLFVNGSLIGSAGNLQNGQFSLDFDREFPLRDDRTAPSTVALRLTGRYASTVPLGRYPVPSFLAGDPTSLHDRRNSVIVAQFSHDLLQSVCFSIVGIVGLIVLGLWLSARSRTELLLLAGNSLALPIIYLNYLGLAAFLPYPVAVYFLLWAIPAFVTNICRTWFFFALAQQRVPWFFWILIGLATSLHLVSGVVPLVPPVQSLWLDLLRVHQLAAVSQFASVLESTAPFFAFLPWRKLSPRMKPLAALCLAWGVTMAIFFFVRLTGAHVPGLPDLQSRWSNIVSDLEAVATLGVLIALLTLLFREHQQTARERALLAGEIQAAQEIQRMLVPPAVHTLSGLRIDIAFCPMREVGGDFYLCRVLPGGRQRTMIGDVSGKGAAAAMTAAMLIGAAGRRDSDSPAQLLRHLNAVLTDAGLGGFATCLCADITADGTLTLANAGHPPPFLNGREVPLAGSLPLGIAEAARYEESQLQLRIDDFLVLYSDGLLEARNSQGEIFSFDRLAALVADRPSADQALQAAQSFGQDDDITVLTLTRLASGEKPTHERIAPSLAPA